jgi:oleandomycin transport system permease protein
MTTGTLTPARTLPTSGPVRGPVWAILQGGTLTWRSLMRLKHSPAQIWDLVMQPVILTTVFVFLFGGAMLNGNRHDYLQFVLPGIMVQTVVFATLGTGAGLHADIAKGIFDRFRSMPVARSAPLVGAIVGDLCRYLISVLVVLVYGVILGFRISTSVLAIVPVLALLMAFSFALCWTSALGGITAKTPQSLQGFGFMVMFPLTFGSNVFTPTDTLPGFIQAWVKVNPVTQLTDTTRGLLLGGPVLTPLLRSLVWIGAITVVFAPLAIQAYRRKA